MALARILKSGQYSDATIRCADREWKVHRAILCSQSAYFETAFNSDFREGQTRSIELHEDPQHIQLMLDSAYGVLSVSNGYSVFDAIDLHAAMDKYLFEKFQTVTALAVGVMSKKLIDQRNLLAFVDVLHHTLQYQDMQVTKVRKQLEKVTAVHIMSLLPLPGFKTVLEGWSSIATEALLAMPARLQGMNADSAFGIQYTVRCPFPSCDGSDRNWNFSGGPAVAKNANCVFCGVSDILVFDGHKRLPDSRAVHFKCSYADCKSKGAVWQAFNVIRRDSRANPHCIWCGLSSDLQIENMGEDTLSGKCALCPPDSP